ncbi:MFS transporter [Ktedonobacter racemifer]|nr:MFS transporter [Ktedonobacter racemifer]
MFGRFQRNARLYLINSALSGVSLGIILILYNLYLISLGYDTDFIGLVLFVATISAAITIFPAGLCIDRFGGKMVLIWASVAGAIAGVGQILFHQPVPLLASSIIAGVVGAFFVVINAPFLTANSAPAERPHLFSLNIVLLLATAVVGQLLGGVLPLWFRAISWLMAPLPPGLEWILVHQVEARSYQLPLLFAGIIALPSFIPLLLMSDDRPAYSAERASRQDTIPWRQQIGLLVQRIRLRTILVSPIFVLTLVQVLIGLGAGLLLPYLNVYFVYQLGVSSALFGLLDGGANMISALLSLIAPWLAIRIGKINTITLTRLISIPLLFTIGITPFLPLAAALFLFRRGAMNMSAGIFQVFSMEAVPREHRGLANSTYQASYQVAWAVSAPVGGLIIARVGYLPVFIGAAILYLLATVILWGCFRGREATLTEEAERQDMAE